MTLKIAPDPPAEGPLVHAVMHHVISQVRQGEGAKENEAERMAKAQDAADQDHAHHWRRADEWHHVAAAVIGIGMVATMHHETEPRGGGNPPIQMKYEAMKKILNG